MSLKVKLYQSFYKTEQKQFLDRDCIPFDNTSNLTPDLREYPQMKEVHLKHKDEPDSAYGLISWKFQDKTKIAPYKFMDFIQNEPLYDCWIVNPCFILESIVGNPWEQGEWHHPGITQLAKDVMIQTGDYKVLDTNYQIDFTNSIYPKNNMFFCNFFVGRPKFWNRLFDFTDRFYAKVEEVPDFKKRMMAASGYASDPNMSHFIFLFERLVPTFLLHNPDIHVKKYEYIYPEVGGKVIKNEFDHIKALIELKELLMHDRGNELLRMSYSSLRQAFMEKYPKSVYKE